MTKTLISFLQITYQEFLPSVLGTRAWKAAGLDSQEVSGQYGQGGKGVVKVVRGVQCGHVSQGDQGGQANLVDWDGQCGHGSQGGHSLIRMVRMVIVFVVVRMIRLIRLVRLARLVRVVRGSVCNKLYCLLFRQQTQNTMTKLMPQLLTSSQLLPTALATR